MATGYRVMQGVVQLRPLLISIHGPCCSHSLAPIALRCGKFPWIAFQEKLHVCHVDMQGPDMICPVPEEAAFLFPLAPCVHVCPG